MHAWTFPVIVVLTQGWTIRISSSKFKQSKKGSQNSTWAFNRVIDLVKGRLQVSQACNRKNINLLKMARQSEKNGSELMRIGLSLFFVGPQHFNLTRRSVKKIINKLILPTSITFCRFRFVYTCLIISLINSSFFRKYIINGSLTIFSSCENKVIFSPVGAPRINWI